MIHEPTCLRPLMSPRSSKHVARLLEEGDEEVRAIGLAMVTPDARRFMETKQGSEMFAALLRRPDLLCGDLEDIVNAAFKPGNEEGGEEPQQLDSSNWLKSLKMLITAVAQGESPDLRARLVGYLRDEGVMNRAGGNELLEHCFAVMAQEETKALILHAIDTMDDKWPSQFGSRSLAVCFRHAFLVDELERFETAVSKRAVEMAMGTYSNYLVQAVVEHGSEKYVILDWINADVARLSRHQHGHYVVQSLFLKTTGESRNELLRRLIRVFQKLDEAQLMVLVRDPFASRVLSSLLDTARMCLNEPPGRKLAQRLSALPVWQEKGNPNVRLVMTSLQQMGL